MVQDIKDLLPVQLRMDLAGVLQKADSKTLSVRITTNHILYNFLQDIATKSNTDPKRVIMVMLAYGINSYYAQDLIKRIDEREMIENV